MKKWQHSTRLPKAIDAAINSALGLAELGFIPGAEWFLTQASNRAQLVDYLDREVVKRLRSAQNEVAKRSDLLVSPLRSGRFSERKEHPYESIEQLERGIRKADAVACVNAVANLLDFDIPLEIFIWGFLPQIRFIRSLRDIQNCLESLPSNLGKLEFLKNLSKDFRPWNLKFPPDLLLILQDARGALWGVSSRERHMLSRPGRFEAIAQSLMSILSRNKTEVKLAENDNVPAFWKQRKAVELELNSILAEASEEVENISDILPKSEIIFLGMPTWLCNFPFEALNCLRSKRVVRGVPIPRVFAGYDTPIDGGFAVVNPGGDLDSTEAVISGVLKSMTDFQLTVGNSVAEEVFIQGLQSKKDFVYAGHCGGERFFNGSAIQKAKVISRVHLFGCRSAEIHRGFSTPWHYLIGGAPSVTAVLWDVLGRDCDRVSRIILADVLGKAAEVIEALISARKSAKFPVMTGAAFIIYQPINQPS